MATIFRRIEAALEGEEQLDGLRCLKVRVYRWFQPNAAPLTQHLWLAPDRNYHCVKEEYLWNKMRLHEMRVHELREVAPGVWFPARITVNESQNNGGNQAVVSHTETIVENVDLAPRHEPAFFRDVPIPAGLPVFTIKDRRLVGSMLPEPFDDDWGKRKLAELAARVSAEEKRYDNLEVKARTITRYPHSVSSQNVRYDEMAEERSIVRKGLAYSTSYQKIASSGHWQDTGFRINAYDGQWTRFFWGQGPRDHPQGFGVTLRRGSAKGSGGISVHRPHMPMMRRNWLFGSLGDTLASSHHERPGQMPFRFRYCGAAEVDGHPCIEVRGDNDTRELQSKQLARPVPRHRSQRHPDQVRALRQIQRLPAHADEHQPLRRLPRDRAGPLVSVPRHRVRVRHLGADQPGMARPQLAPGYHDRIGRPGDPRERGGVPRRGRAGGGQRAVDRRGWGTMSPDSSRPRPECPRSR